jgi:curved DNA-binding protein CbpA
MRRAKPPSDPYHVLGLVRAADVEQIRAAHRQLAKRFHPDGSTADEQRFLAVQEAYQLLSDPLRRGEWDRRHAPGPVRANAARARRSRSAGAASGRTRKAATVRQTAAARPRRPARDGRSRSHTWSAERVPWWEDFRPPQRRSNGDGTTERDTSTPGNSAASGPNAAPSDTMPPGGPAPDTGSNERPAPKGPAVDFDVFSRSRGAAWSRAARRHFRKGDEDLPSRGAWRYRGTQVVTGAEARKVAAEEAAAEFARQRRAKRSTRERSSTTTGQQPDDDIRRQ